MDEQQGRKKQGAGLPFKLWVFVSVVVVIASAALAFAIYGAHLLGYKPYPVVSDKLSPEIEQGALAYLEEVDPAGISEGAVILHGASAGDDCAVSSVVSNDERAKVLIVKTDAQSSSGNARVPYSRVIGEVSFSLPYLGYLYDYVITPSGMYVAVAAGGAVVVLFVLAPLLVGILSKRKRAGRAQAEDAQIEALARAQSAGSVESAASADPAPPAASAAGATSAGEAELVEPAATSAASAGSMAPVEAVASMESATSEDSTRVQTDARHRASAHSAQRPELRRESIPSPMMSSAYSMPHSIVVNPSQSVPFATTVVVPGAGVYQLGETLCAPQIVLRIEKDPGGERPVVFVPEVDHQVDASLLAEDELQRAEEELRVAEMELRAMQADVRQSEVGLLRAQAEIKLAEAELLRAKAELIERKRVAAGMADCASSHASGFDGQSSEEIPVD